MELRAEGLLDELRTLIGELGRDGGLMSPSVYDTAQVLRLYAPKEGVEPGLQWLLAQQEADGGWGNPRMPGARDVPTLAAMLALHTYRQIVPAETEVEAGLRFLQVQAGQWAPPLPHDIPVAVELLLPRLVQEARQMGLGVAVEPYRALVDLGRKKRQFIAKLPARPGTPYAFSFEAWGTEPLEALLDSLGSVSNSPSATAAWLRLAAGRPELADAVQRAEHYLARANTVTDSHIPGLSPTAWPINRFEQAIALHALLLGNVFRQEKLLTTLFEQVADLRPAIGSAGLGFSDQFMADGDDTAAALAVAQAVGFEQDPNVLLRYKRGSHFSGYPKEFQPSISVTARATGVLASYGMDTSPWQQSLARAQTPEGIWQGDKWNVSWLYTTCLVLNALRGPAYVDTKRAAYEALHQRQHRDGGWGMGSKATMLETAMGLLAVTGLRDDSIQDPRMEYDIERAFQWLLRKRQSCPAAGDELWLNKQLYCPARIDQGFILGALARVALDCNPSAVYALESYANPMSLSLVPR